MITAAKDHSDQYVPWSHMLENCSKDAGDIRWSTNQDDDDIIQLMGDIDDT